jgi:NAD(P)-dependent dehydrogenase (short-subunit alcohol dehydrogenase family)
VDGVRQLTHGIEGELSGKSVIVTGAAHGLGLALAHGLLRTGASVVMLDRDQDNLTHAVQSLSAEGWEPLPILADIRREKEIDTAVQTAVTHFGRLDALVNNAGVLMRHVTDQGADRPKFWEIDPVRWRELFDINMTGTWLFARRAALQMMDQGHGSIINVITSPHTMVSEAHIPYGPSKAAIEAFTVAGAKQLQPHGVRMNALYPGDTGDRDAASGQEGRPIMVSAAIHLISDASSDVSGQSVSAHEFNKSSTLRRTE